VLNSYPRIYNPGALFFREGEDRIQSRLADVGNRFGEVGNAQQYIFYRLQIDGWPRYPASKR
jgi:hypothetical protein